MYKLKCIEVKTEEETRQSYGAIDPNGFFIEFTDSKETAERVIGLLNECKAEPCHVADIIEDIFYS